jgi:type IV secretory pathway VirB10-like protein
MAETTPSPAPLTDKRPTPRGVLPRRLQMWLMVALALGMLVIIALTGQSRPTPRTTAPAAVESQTPNADRLRDYQDRLRALDARTTQARRESEAPAPAVHPVVDEPSGVRDNPDPIKDERRRREYESLFATNVIISRRPESQRLVTGRPPDRTGVASSAERAPGDELPAPPSLDAVADAVVRASTRYAPPSDGQPHSDDVRLGAGAQSTPGAPATTRSGTTSPISDAGPMYRLLEGTVIDTVLINRVDGGTAAPVNCLVTTPVYAQNGQVLLIPSGARILGDTKPVQSFGESRLAVAFDRLLLPDGHAYALDHFLGLNDIGDAGLRDKVDQHYRATFGAAAAVGLLSGLAQSLTSWGTNRTGTVVIAGSAGEATAQATAQTMNRFLNRLPTVTIREGHRVKVYLTSDLDLPAYPSGPAPSIPTSATRIR